MSHLEVVLAVEHPAKGFHPRRGVEGTEAAGEKSVENDAKTEHVRGEGDDATGEHLWTRVLDGALKILQLVARFTRCNFDSVSKVNNLQSVIRVEVGEYEVVGHEVEVDHPLPVQEREALQHLSDQQATFLLRERVVWLGESLKKVSSAKVFSYDDGLEVAVDNSNKLWNVLALLQPSQQLGLRTSCADWQSPSLIGLIGCYLPRWCPGQSLQPEVVPRSLSRPRWRPPSSCRC